MATPANPYSATHEELQPATPPAHRAWIGIGLIVGTLVLLAAVVVTAVLAFVAGAVVGTSDVYHQRATRQADQIRIYLGSQEERYADVTIHEASNGWSYLEGSVDSQEDFDQLHDELKRLFGEELAEDMMRLVEIKEQAVPPAAAD
ncbi:MAG TPA: hypothetical protein VFV87_05395 [Pirellulaceae bacterium]|nr:hypothetical protein [Pirellulaceae bacterium]